MLRVLIWKETHCVDESGRFANRSVSLLNSTQDRLRGFEVISVHLDNYLDFQPKRRQIFIRTTSNTTSAPLTNPSRRETSLNEPKAGIIPNFFNLSASSLERTRAVISKE